MGRISEDTRAHNEAAIRAAMDRLLRGDLPPGGKCDLRTLASEAGVPRTAFYAKKNRDGTARTGPYQHLAQEFERRLTGLRETGTLPDPRTVQIERLKETNTGLKTRLEQRDAELETLKDFKRRALSQIAAQHLEIERLQEQSAGLGNVRRIPPSRVGAAPYGSCS
jgi:hypothetical protein